MPKYVAKGTTVTYDSNTVGAVQSISTPDGAKEEVDVTTHDSAGIYREFLAGLVDPGNVAIECIHDPDDVGQQAMVTDFGTAGNVTREVVVTVPTTAVASGTHTITFNAFVQSKGPIVLPGNTADAATRTFNLRVSGGDTEATA